MQLTPAAILVTFAPTMAAPILDAVARYLGADATGVTVRIAGRRGLRYGCVTLSDGNPEDGIGSFTWFREHGKLGAAIARALKARTELVMYERRSDWEQSTSFDAGGQSFTTARSLDESVAAFVRDGLDPRYAADGLPLGVRAAISGLRRHHLEDLIDSAPGVTCTLGEPLPADLEAMLDATLGVVPAELSEEPRAIELLLPAAIGDELALLRRKLRTAEHHAVEAVWRIAIRANLYDELADTDNVRLRPYNRFARPKLERVVATWHELGVLADTASRPTTVTLPERVIAELHELAAHVDRSASWLFERAYRHARASAG